MKVSATPRMTTKVRAAFNPDPQLQAGPTLLQEAEEWRRARTTRTQTSLLGHI